MPSRSPIVTSDASGGSWYVPGRAARVYLCDGDRSGWAIDEDRRLTARALEGLVEFVDSPAQAEVIHACWWQPLMELKPEACEGKPVVCHMAGDPARCLGEVWMKRAWARVTHWVAQSLGAHEKLACFCPRVHFAPYVSEDEPPVGEPSAASARAIAAIPSGAYAIANFHRDTAGEAFGPGMGTPKLVKGPDLFVEILAELVRRGERVVALLAGPRRHWVRRELSRRSVPWIFAGEVIDGEDYPSNILPRSELFRLYRASRLALCTSRSEGGPRSILEAALAGTPQLSTRVGIAPDILHPDGLFGDVIEAVEKIQRDIASGFLSRHAASQSATARAVHSIDASRGSWRELYASLAEWTPSVVPARRVRPRAARVSLWNKFTPPPWGGGNQFMTALLNEARRQGIDATINGEGAPADAHILNSVQFDVERFRGMVEPGSARVVHRIDGPISVLRGTPESMEQDRACFDVNRTYATSTVVQSWHTMRSLAELGFEPVRPVLIHNACDPGIFRAPESPREPGVKLKVIATSWSPSPGKGAAIYAWLDEHLDFSRFEVTFVGNCPAKLRNIRVVPPRASEPLADLLREHDVYLTASRNDPCSNALIEALTCGLPALYLDSGGHPELVGFAGLPFRRPAEIPALLDRVWANHAAYRSLIRVESLTDVAKRYLSLALG